MINSRTTHGRSYLTLLSITVLDGHSLACFVLTITFLTGVPCAAKAQDAGKFSVSTLQQRAPGFLVHAAVNRESRDYREGDSFSLSVVSEIDAWIYVIYQQVDGQAYQVFPNAGQPDNRIAAKREVQIPARDDLFRWRIAAPFGTETVKVIATDQPLQGLSDPRLRRKRFNPVSARVLSDVQRELKIKQPGTVTDVYDSLPGVDVPDDSPQTPLRWAETEIEVTTYARNTELEDSGSKRFGVFFGVSDHKYSELQQLANGHTLDLSSPHRDAIELAALLNDIGDLEDSRVFTNADATRRNLEQAITQWLPSQSKPGDTVVIYFSGHGGRIPDDNRDEKDQEDEFLLPHDYLGLSALSGLLQQIREGTVQQHLRTLAEFARNLLRRAGSIEKASELLARETGVSDDLFGHWLQSLDGRQIIVVLDICHAGGFATQEKGLKRSAKSGGFDFLDQEVSRLKDIGQGNTVLLTASTSDELSLVRPDGELSVMTWHLLEVLKAARGPLDIDAAYKQLKARMDTFFESDEFKAMNEGLDKPFRPHHPLLYKQISGPVWLKP